MTAFILVPCGSAAFGFRPNQHEPRGQKLSLAGLLLPLPKAMHHQATRDV